MANPIIQLRVSDNDPYVYEQPSTAGSVAIGTDSSESNKLKIVMSDAISNLDPSSATIVSGSCSVSIDPTVNGNIEFCPKGSGQTNFARGSVAIEGQGSTAGNLLMNNTTASGLSGVIEYGGNRFIHDFGTDNAFVGKNAGTFNAGIGQRNVAIGSAALSNIGSAGPVSNNNIAIGSSALGALAGAAGNNVAIGTSALASTASDFSNVAIGTGALQALNGSGSAISNVAVGVDAGQHITNATQNVIIGTNAGSNLLTGASNNLIGNGSGISYTGSETNNQIIGNAGVVGDNNKIRIGNSSNNACQIRGISGTSITATGTVVIDGSGNLGSSSSLPIAVPVTVPNGGTGQTSLLESGVLVGDGVDPITSLVVGSNGQVLVGATGADPAFATLSSSGSTLTYTTGANTLNIDINAPVTVPNGGTGQTSLTAHSVQVGNGTGTITQLAVGSNGQVLIGSSAADPAFATLTSSGGTITFTTGANTLNLEAASSGGFTYTDETSSPITLAPANGYTANLGSLLTFNMPASVAYGSVFEVLGKGTGLWSVVLSGGQTIKYGIASGTTSISSTLQYDNVKIVCITANTLFEVVRAVGNLTVV